LAAIDHIFSELRYYEDRARADEGSRDTRLGALVALSGAVLGLLASSIPGGHLQTDAIILLCISVAFFVLAILVATQLVIRLPLVSNRFGGHLERVKEVDLSEFDYYLTSSFQEAENADLQRRVLPVMRSAIGSRRRNVARKERSLAVAIWLIAAGLLAAAAYAAILVL
jgi:hypothetical protein